MKFFSTVQQFAVIVRIVYAAIIFLQFYFGVLCFNNLCFPSVMGGFYGSLVFEWNGTFYF